MTSITIIDCRDISELASTLTAMLKDGPVQVRLSGRKARSLSQNSLMWIWYRQISEWLKSKGKDFAGEQWVHDAMCHTFLGWRTVEMVDVITGEKTSRDELIGTSGLDVGEMKLYLDLVYQWALGYGLLLTIPEDCEYNRMKKEELGL